MTGFDWTRLAEALGVKNLWIKNDAVNFPTLSFKDRVVAVALTRARELGFETVACASTGNTSASAAAYAVKAGMVCAVLVPSGKIALVLSSLIPAAPAAGRTCSSCATWRRARR